MTTTFTNSATCAGYYYRSYSAETFNVSSLLQTVTPTELLDADVKATLKPNAVIEDFSADWQKEWFTYKPEDWARSTNKLHDDVYKAASGSQLTLEVLCEQKNKLVIMIDSRAAEVALAGGDEWQSITLSPGDFRNFAGEGFVDWNGVKQLKLCAAERLKAEGRGNQDSRIVGGNWRGTPPEFRALRWTMAESP